MDPFKRQWMAVSRGLREVRRSAARRPVDVREIRAEFANVMQVAMNVFELELRRAVGHDAASLTDEDD